MEGSNTTRSDAILGKCRTKHLASPYLGDQEKAIVSIVRCNFPEMLQQLTSVTGYSLTTLFRHLIKWHSLTLFLGYKFETLCTMPAPWGETSREYIEERDNHVVNNKEQYCSVVRTGLGKTTICLGGEVDCCKWEPRHGCSTT